MFPKEHPPRTIFLVIVASSERNAQIFIVFAKFIRGTLGNRGVDTAEVVTGVHYVVTERRIRLRDQSAYSFDQMGRFVGG
jgi:hypothetical protein